MIFFEKLDLSNAARVFVVGDIHGMFSLLEKQLKKLKFDPERDVLISVGDLVDRGPESHRVLEFVDQPWFFFVKGNHEQLVINNCYGRRTREDYAVHARNGGKWFDALSPDEQINIANRLDNSPVILEALLPSGRRIGVVHADLPTNDWDDIEKIDPNQYRDWLAYCLWERTRARNPNLDGIRNIDHVYFGHTIFRSVFRVGNCSWIDTGAYSSGILSIIEVK